MLFGLNLSLGRNIIEKNSNIITVTRIVKRIGPQVSEIRSGLAKANIDKINTSVKVVTIADIMTRLSVNDLNIG